jgi:hypothetical protein
MALYEDVARRLRKIARQHEADFGGKTEESESISAGATAIVSLKRAFDNLKNEYSELLFRVGQAEALLEYYQSEYAGKWVPISSGKFPADRQRVLTIGRNRGIQICRFEADGTGGGDFITARQGIAFVRSWMPLPPLPGDET